MHIIDLTVNDSLAYFSIFNFVNLYQKVKLNLLVKTTGFSLGMYYRLLQSFRPLYDYNYKGT